MKLYFRFLLQIVLAFVIFGFIAPYLISSDSNELVILGLIIIVAEVSHLIFFIHKLTKNKKNEKN